MGKECVMCGGDAGEYGNNPAPLNKYSNQIKMKLKWT